MLNAQCLLFQRLHFLIEKDTPGHLYAAVSPFPGQTEALGVILHFPNLPQYLPPLVIEMETYIICFLSLMDQAQHDE